MFQDLNTYVSLIEKIFGVLGAVIYLIFSLVIVKQVASMTKSIKDKFNGVLIVLSYFHLITAFLLVFLAFTIL